MTRRAKLWAVAIALLAFGAYATNLGNGFAMDDAYNIVGNTDIRDLRNIPGAFTHAVGAGSVSAYDRSIGKQFWRPVATVSYAVDYQVWGLHPAGYHLTGNLLHAASAALLLLLLLEWTSLWPALVGAAWFAVHPVHTEAVDLATYRTELLAALACVAALLVLARDNGRRKPSAILWISALYALGLCAKETAVTLPAWLLAAELLRDRSRKPWLPLYFALTAVLGGWFLARHALHLEPSPVQFFAGLTPWQVACSVLKIYPTYLRLLVWPWPLTPFYDWTVLPPAVSLADPLALLGLVLLATTVLLAIRAWRSKPLIALGISWWLLGLLPFTQILRLPVGAAERFLYFPTVGIALALAALAQEVQARAPLPLRRAGLLAAGLVLALLAAVTLQRNPDWHDDTTLLEATVHGFPGSFNAHHMLGQRYVKAGRLPDAEAQLRTAEALLPGVPQNGLWLGRALLAQKRFGEAQAVLQAVPEGDAEREALLQAAQRRGR